MLEMRQSDGDDATLHQRTGARCGDVSYSSLLTNKREEELPISNVAPKSELETKYLQHVAFVVTLRRMMQNLTASIAYRIKKLIIYNLPIINKGLTPRLIFVFREFLSIKLSKFLKITP
ncbi:unnamed protein product [Xylocopa violacea]|uniref:Uncharacterized protein n=1 Tax=Xylocopa violacea TaxID=135666 RepID=A0ABP1NP47_XYLVO